VYNKASELSPVQIRWRSCREATMGRPRFLAALAGHAEAWEGCAATPLGRLRQELRLRYVAPHLAPLPHSLKILDAQHMAFHDLVTTAVLEQDREAAAHALVVDPLTAAVCSLAEIRQMFDEMVEAQRDYLPEFLL